MVTLEAMACGVPCIVSEGGIGVVNDRVDGLINKDCDISQIKNNIMHFYNNRDDIEKMGLNAYETIKRHTWEAYAKGIASVYESL